MDKVCTMAFETQFFGGIKTGLQSMTRGVEATQREVISIGHADYLAGSQWFAVYL